MEIIHTDINLKTGTVSDELYDRLRDIKHVALDMDGTIYSGRSLFPFTISFLNNLKKLGIRYSFLTNNPSKSIHDYQIHLKDMGISIRKDEIYTSALAAIDYLKKHYPLVKRLFILGTSSMVREFASAGFESTRDDANDIPDAVVVAFDKTLTYSRLCRAAWWISKNLLYLATNPDRVCPTDDPTILVDCGSICSCLQMATGREPDVVTGKPDPRMLDGIMQHYGLAPCQIAMVGDRIYTDMKMAVEAKTLGVLVLTGETSLQGVLESEQNPDIVADDLAVFGRMLIEAHHGKRG